MPNTLQNIPLATDLLSVSQGDLKQNCDYFVGALGKDHQIVFGDSDTGTVAEGRHLGLSLIDKGAQAFPGDGTDSFFYSTAGNIFWRNASVGPVQITDKNVVPSAIQNKGFTYLPGGIMLCWGTQAANLALGNPINFPNGGFTTVFIATGCTSANDRPFAVTAISTTQLTYSVTNPAGVTIYWWAIGAK